MSDNRARGLPAWGWAIIGGGIAVIAGLVVALVIVTTGGESSTAAAEDGSDSEPKTMSVTGSITLTDGNLGTEADGTCYGRGGYDDMVDGAQVVVRDGAGETLAIGELGDGYPVSEVQCRFSFVIPGVPADKAVYEVEVSHRGGFSFTAAEARGLALTLG